MKKVLFTIALMLLPMLASAQDAVEIGGIYYYLDNETKTAEVTSDWDSPYEGDIVIPPTVEYEETGTTYSVTTIGPNAFAFSNVPSIIIPNSVTTIGEYAFYGCIGLSSINIPSSVVSIGSGVFGFSENLTSISVDEANPNYMSVDDVLMTKDGKTLMAYPASKVGAAYTIPDGVTKIDDAAFANCYDIKSITIPNSVTEISWAAFANCYELTSITIPASVTGIGEGAFEYCVKLPSISVDEANPNYMSVDGVLMTKDEKTLLTYPAGKEGSEYTIPDGVAEIGVSAFIGCDQLTSITIPSSVTNIRTSAFYDLSELKNVYCQAEDVPTTEEYAFNSDVIINVTLHVPEKAIDDYKAVEPWKLFKSIVALEGDELPDAPKCATPTISYANGELEFSCETEDVEFVSKVTVDDAKESNSSKVSLTGVYQVSVYAKKKGYKKSDTATKEIQISSDSGSGIVGDVNNDDVVNAADVVKLVNIIMGK